MLRRIGLALRAVLYQGGIASLTFIDSFIERILLEITNHPVCAAKERDLLIESQPPLLEKEGNGPASTAF